MTAKLLDPRPARRWGSGTAAIVRLLIAAQEPVTQVAIAQATGIMIDGQGVRLGAIDQRGDGEAIGY